MAATFLEAMAAAREAYDRRAGQTLLSDEDGWAGGPGDGPSSSLNGGDQGTGSVPATCVAAVPRPPDDAAVHLLPAGALPDPTISPGRDTPSERTRL